jgi:hypothetical protein
VFLFFENIYLTSYSFKLCKINNACTTTISSSISTNSLYDNLYSQKLPSSFINDQTDSQENTQIKRMKFHELINQSTYPQNTNINNNNNKNNLSLSAYRSDTHNSSNDEDIDLISSFSFNSNSNSNTSPISNNKTNNTFYGLPQICKDLLKELRNIGCLYEWQDELMIMVNQKYEAALQKIPFVLNNLLYLSPTR